MKKTQRIIIYSIIVLSIGIFLYNTSAKIPPKSKKGRALQEIATIRLEIDFYYEENHEYPKDISSLIKNISVDPWGNEYQYRIPSKKEGDEYDVFSLGEDGLEDTEDDIYKESLDIK
jgi:general secretion pathway protein G